MEKEYIVITKEGVDIEKVDVQLREIGGNAIIPHRQVTCANSMNHNNRMTHWMLTDEEAETMRQDERILSIELPLKDRSDIGLTPTVRQSSTFDKSNTASNVNWGISRCTSATNNFASGVDTVTEEYIYCLDGEGVDVVIMDTGIEANHPEWQDANGNSRLKQIDWYAESGGNMSGTLGNNFYTDTDGHGTFCAGIVAGKTYGWAKGADIYSMKIFDSDQISTGDALDLIRHWHNNKGTGRPTVVNMSFSYFHNIDVGAQAGDSGSHFNGTDFTTWTYGDSGYGSSSDVSYRTNISHFTKLSARVTEIDTRIDQMIADGIHVVIAGGNFYDAQYQDTVEANDNYNDFLVRGGQTYFYHRGCSPRTTNNGYDIVVGNISSSLNDDKDQSANSSARGPAVDIFAPGTNITSASSNTNVQPVVGDYPDNVSFKIANSSGTSFSAPQVSGLAAMYLQLFPTLTPEQLKEKIVFDSKKELMYDVLEANYNELAKYQYIFSGGLFAAPNRILYNRFDGDIMVKWSSS